MLDFPYQFVLARNVVEVPANWRVLREGGWRLAVHPRTRVFSISCGSDDFVGWVIGWVINGSGTIFEPAMRVDQSNRAASPDDTLASLEAELAQWAGRFVLIAITRAGEKVYTDASASLGVVFSRTAQVVASTASLIPLSKGSGTNAALVQALGLPIKDTWFPFGLTARTDIERLLPNRALDLAAWSTERLWPKTLVPRTTDPTETIRRIGRAVEASIGAVAAVRPVEMSLTAGRDSRMLLACARPWLDQISFFTFALPDPTARLDCDIARRLAGRAKLRHTVIPWVAASEQELHDWLERTGNCVAGRVWKGAGVDAKLSEGEQIQLTGLAGEVGRAYYWRESDTEGSVLTEHEIVTRLRLPTDPLIVKATQDWWETVPVHDTLLKLDLLYIENRLGCWAGPSMYGSQRRFFLSPFNSRSVFDAMLSLPPDLRRTNFLPQALIEERWPELLLLPFNTPVGWKQSLKVSARYVARVVREDGLGAVVKKAAARVKRGRNNK